jgi:4-amino-4-deoxy-L-arabinose transferase-like glycosyltransferase
MYPFSTTLWGHPTAAACLFFAFYALVVRRNAYLTGLFLGLAVLIEYSAALVIPCYLGYHVWKQRWRSVHGLTQIFVAALPSLAVFLWYHKTCFGGWLAMPTVFQNPWFGLQSNERVFHVLALPDPVVLWKLLFGLERGLFLISPVLLFSVYGFYLLAKSRKLDAEVVVALCIVLVYWAFNGAYVGWRAGHSSGPRYLITENQQRDQSCALTMARLFRVFWYFRLRPAASRFVRPSCQSHMWRPCSPFYW